MNNNLRDYLPKIESVKPQRLTLSLCRTIIGEAFVSASSAKGQAGFHNLISGPSSPTTGSVFGSFTSGIVFSAL